MLHLRPWSGRLTNAHRPIKICERCGEQWPCARERDAQVVRERLVAAAREIGGKRASAT